MMKLRRGTSHLDIGPKVLVVLIAIVLIIGAVDALYSLICQLPMATFSIMIYPIVQIIPVILLLKYLNKPAKYLIFIFAFFMGLIDLISNIIGLSGLSFSLGMLSMFLDIIFIVSAIHAFLGDKHSASRLFYVSLGMIAMHCGELITFYAAGQLMDYLHYALILACNAAAYLLYTIFLLQPGVRDETIGRKLKIGMTSVEAMMSVSPKAYILRKDVDSLLGKDTSRWTVINHGPIEAKFETCLYDDSRKFIITSKKWKGDDTVTINIDQQILTDSYGKSYPIRSYRTEEAEDGEYLRIYGDDGFFMRILLADEPEKVRFSFLHKTENDEKSNLIADSEEKVLGQ